MSNQTRATATVEVKLDTPIPFVWLGGEVKQGTYVQFEANQHGPGHYHLPNHDAATATLFAWDHSNQSLSVRIDGEWSPPLPDWCPTPPDGWDAHVQAFRETLKQVAK